jgi:hypothetical protein
MAHSLNVSGNPNHVLCLNKIKGKVMLAVFFDAQGLVHYEFTPKGIV